jgi:hypothetical protein
MPSLPSLVGSLLPLSERYHLLIFLVFLINYLLPKDILDLERGFIPFRNIILHKWMVYLYLEAPFFENSAALKTSVIMPII